VSCFRQPNSVFQRIWIVSFLNSSHSFVWELIQKLNFFWNSKWKYSSIYNCETRFFFLNCFNEKNVLEKIGTSFIHQNVTVNIKKALWLLFRKQITKQGRRVGCEVLVKGQGYFTELYFYG
jgi:hypothetical protein